MALSEIEQILVLAKTYPSPSSNYIETSCVAGINDKGQMRRLYPVPFRLMSGDKQFKKWQWINVRITKAPQDHRPESHRVFIDTIDLKETITSKGDWLLRKQWLDKMPAFPDIEKLQEEQIKNKTSLALIKPVKICKLEISKARHSDWTDEEKEKMMRYKNQGNLFENNVTEQINILRKIPVDFYYHYQLKNETNSPIVRSKIIDWEVGALYWNCFKRHGSNWETPFRNKLEGDLPNKDLIFFMGNLHRFQDQWLIISLIYPPKPKPTDHLQPSLF